MPEFSVSPAHGTLWAKWCVAAGLALTFHAEVSAQTLETHPEFDVGDKWTYRHHNKGDRKEPYLYTHQAYKSEADSGWIFGVTQEPNAPRPNFILRYDYQRADAKEGFAFNPQKPTTPGRRYGNWQPQDDYVQLPLSVGKKYAIKVYWNDGNGYTKYDVEVDAFTKVKTEAGEFEAYRIKASGWWTRVKPTSDGWTGSGRAEYTIYYAPSAKRYVKWEWFDRQANGSPWNERVTELVKWEPKAPLDAALTAPAPVAATPAVPASQ